MYSFRVSVFCCSSVAGGEDSCALTGRVRIAIVPTFPPSQPLFLTCFQPRSTSVVGGSCLPTPCDWLGIKVIEARRSSRHAGAKTRKNKASPQNLRAYGLARGIQLLSSHPANHTGADTSCSGYSVEFGRILHAVIVYLFTVTQAPRP